MLDGWTVLSATEIFRGWIRAAYASESPGSRSSMLLLPSLIQGAPSRTINVASVVSSLVNLTRRRFRPLAAYAGSKMAQIFFSCTLEMRIPKCFAFHHLQEIFSTWGTVQSLSFDSGQKGLGGFRPTLQGQICWCNSAKSKYNGHVEGARSVLFCATDQQDYEYARGLRGKECPLALYVLTFCKPGTTSSHADDLECAEKGYRNTLVLVGLPEDYVEEGLGNRTFAGPVNDVKDD